MDGMEAKHEMAMAGERRTPTQRLRQPTPMFSVPAPPAAEPPPSRRWNELGPQTKTSLAVVAGLVGIVITGVWAFAMQFRDMREALLENTKAVQSLSSVVWTISDEVDYAHKMGRMNPTVIMPDPKEVVRERLK
jgi:hypothetical protein